MRILPAIVLLIFFASCEKIIFKDKCNDPEFVFESFWNELDRNYSFFTYTNINWDSVYAKYRLEILPTSSNEDLFRIFTNITDLLNDAHTNIYTSLGVTGNIEYFENFPVNQLDNIEPYFEKYQIYNKIFDYGILKSSNLGYIKIKTFEGEDDNFNEIDTILKILSTTEGLIIDVRSNRGGKISNSCTVINRFADSTRIACKYRFRNGASHTDFTEWYDFLIAPVLNKSLIAKPVALLTNRGSYSATEWFVLSADVLPNTIIVGDTTGGGSAIPITRELANGWILRTSNSQTLLPSGRDFQFTGLIPDYPVWISEEDASKNIDTILEKAISLLSDF